jgi:hypothetical protein
MEIRGTLPDALIGAKINKIKTEINLMRKFAYLRASLRVVSIIAMVVSLTGPKATLSKDDNSNDALATVKKTADDICGAVEQLGTSTEVEAKGTIGGSANLNIGGFLKELIGKLIEGNASISSAWKNDYYQGVLREQLAGVIINNTDCKLAVFNALVGTIMHTAIVQSNNSCPPGASIAIDRSSFFRNRIGVSVPSGTIVCIVDSTMKDNDKGLEVR